jgi:hypothetical protein
MLDLDVMSSGSMEVKQRSRRKMRSLALALTAALPPD